MKQDLGFQSNQGTAVDLSPFTTGSHFFRFGSQDNPSNNQAVTYLAHIQLYTSSFIDPSQSITPILENISCPNLATTTMPACSSFVFFYKLIPSYISADQQTIVDSSGSGRDAVNGASSSNTLNDATL